MFKCKGSGGRSRLCVCVCVCEREREREKEIIFSSTFTTHYVLRSLNIKVSILGMIMDLQLNCY